MGKIYQVKRLIKQLNTAPSWQLLMILILTGFLTATFLRIDHITMTRYRAAVLEADQKNDAKTLEKSLLNLRRFVSSHVVLSIAERNGGRSLELGTGTFYLEHAYVRKASAALAEAKAKLPKGETVEGKVHAAASAICDPLAKQYGWQWNSPAYMDCMLKEIDKHPTPGNIKDHLIANIPSTTLYRHSYASPIWAPSLSGIGMIACLLLSIILVIRGAIWLFLHLVLLFLQLKKA